jgi:hypothetical protein
MGRKGLEPPRLGEPQRAPGETGLVGRVDEIIGQSQASEGLLDRDLPCGHDADEDLVGRVFDEASRDLRQARAPFERPNQRVGVEQESHFGRLRASRPGREISVGKGCVEILGHDDFALPTSEAAAASGPHGYERHDGLAGSRYHDFFGRLSLLDQSRKGALGLVHVDDLRHRDRR